ncbi:MAG: hypothetical protein AMXMBFR23_01500 [Chloroflexota bacterium]
MAGWTETVSEFIAGSTTADWPEETLELGRRHILDTLASIVACRDLETAEVARAFALRLTGGTPGGSTILGTREHASLPDAVFASAMTGHGAEINDFCPSAFVQPGPPVVSTALAFAERDHRPGAEVLRAVIAGYELTCRIPKAAGVKHGRALGISSHGFGPVFGAAATASALMRLNAPRVADVLSYCAQQASGSRQWLLDVHHIEKSFVFAGMPARNGVHAALLVEAGFTGVPQVLDQEGGWFRAPLFATGEDYQPEYLTQGLGRRFEMPLVAYKRYPVGGPTQPVVEAMLRLSKQVAPDEVAHVLIEMPGTPQAFAAAEMPALSLPYLCAIILLDGRLDFDAAQSMERFRSDAAAHALMPRVEVRHDPAQEAEPRVESARVTVTRRTGEAVVEWVEHVRGFPANPMTHEDVEAKALELMTPRLGSERARRAIDLAWSIDALPDASVLIEAIARE